jgi:tyrosyl-tRNA synthetase
VVITLPILEGLDGVQKMSKSLGNYVGIEEPPAEMFGKLMSISDALMWRYYRLLSLRVDAAGLERLEARAAAGALNPRDAKADLAGEIVARFHGEAAAAAAREAFERRFREGALPEDMPAVELQAPEGGLPIANLLKDAGLTASTSEALRLVGQGAVRIDGERIEDRKLAVPPGATHVVQVGKRRFARVTLRGAVAESD